MTNRFKLPLWIFPLLIAALVALFGWWGNFKLRETIELELKTQLTTTLNANVTALEIWTTNQLKLATALAGDSTLRNLGAQALAGDGWEFLPTAQEADRLSSYLRPRLDLLGYQIAQLVNTNYIIVASAPRNRQAVGLPISDAHTSKFAELFTTGQPVIITPFKPDLLVQRRAARSDPGQPGTNSFRQNFRPSPTAGRGRRGDITLMQVAAPLRNTNNVVCGALALIVNPDSEFSKILSVARSGDSGETYAFDQTGLLISHSRFDAQLRQIGLLGVTNPVPR